MSAPTFQQLQKQAQTLALTPQMQQSLAVLQMPTLELRELLSMAMETNPLLEETPEALAEKTSAETPEWETPLAPAADTRELERKRQHFLDSIAAPAGSLREHLLEQSLLLNLSPEEKKALLYLTDSLNDRGLLSAPLEELVQTGALEPQAARTALKELQQFDPPGVGAKDLQECLLLQLERADLSQTLAATIVREHFDELPQRKTVQIAKETNTDLAAVEQALATIGHLNPAPGRAFTQPAERTVNADLIFKKENGMWTVHLNEDTLPRLRLSSQYKDMLGRENLSDADRGYLSGQIRDARSLLEAVAHRRRTLENIGRALLRGQHDFFERGPEALKPLTMARVAEEIGMHEATVSRAVAGKFADTPWGFFELRHFFTHGYQSEQGESTAADAVKQRIADIIRNEDPRKPRSDQAISDILQSEGLTIARRTVAKYREEQGIPTTPLRRRFS